jgi:hypothetical protein
VRSGDIIKVRKDIRLDNGNTILRGWTSKVLNIDVIDGVATVEIAASDGSSHWIAMSNVTLA